MSTRTEAQAPVPHGARIREAFYSVRALGASGRWKAYREGSPLPGTHLCHEAAAQACELEAESRNESERWSAS